MDCSVGFPYKEAVVEFCDEVHPLAEVDYNILTNVLEFVISYLFVQVPCVFVLYSISYA